MMSSTLSSSGFLVVQLGIVEAQQIPNIHDPSAGPPFAYAKVKWNNQKYKTDINKTHRWEKSFSIPWRFREDPSILVVEVWSSYPGVDGRHVPIGSVPIDLRSLRVGATSCAFYKLMKSPSCPSFGELSPALMLRIGMVDPESTRTINEVGMSSRVGMVSNVGMSNNVGETVWFTDSSLTPRGDKQCNADAMEDGNSQLIDRMSRENPSATRNEIMLAMRRANFDPVCALQHLDEIMAAKCTNDTDSSSEEDSCASSTSSTAERKLLMTTLSPDEMIKYDEMKMLAKRGDKNAEKSVKEQKRLLKKQQKKMKKQDPNYNKIDKKASKKKCDKKKKGKQHGEQYSPEKSKYQVTGTTRLVSAPIEDRLQELFPYYSLNQIKKVLIKHNFQADAALDELLETRFDELGQSLQAQGLSPTNACAAQEQGGLNNTFLNFKPHAKPLEPRKPTAPSAPPVNQENAVPDNGVKKALLIGIDYIGTDKQLRGCIEDTKLIRKMLTTVYLFPDDDCAITVLTDDNPNPTLKPTKENILIGLQWLVSEAKPGSFLFFHYSGHGSQQRNRHGTEADGMDETIIPLDYTKRGYITDDELHRSLVAPLKPNVKLVCLMDCCHSGSGMDLPFIWNTRRRKWDLEFKPRYSGGDVQLISGCADDETSAEFYIPQQECGGAMTRSLRHSLSLNPFGHTYGSLMDSITKFLRSWGFRQTPKLSSSQNFSFDRPFGLNAAAGYVKLPSALMKPQPIQLGHQGKPNVPPLRQPGKPIVTQYPWPQQQQQQQPTAVQYFINPASSYKPYDHPAKVPYQQQNQCGPAPSIPSAMPQPGAAANYGYAALYSPRVPEPQANYVCPPPLYSARLPEAPLYSAQASYGSAPPLYSPRLPEAPPNYVYPPPLFSPRFSPLAPSNTAARPQQPQNYRPS